MASSKGNGNGRFDDALNALVRAQALLVQTQAEYLAQKVESDKRFTAAQADWAKLHRESAELKHESEVRFARIEAILLDHHHLLEKLADQVAEKVGEKIGFKPK